MDSFSKILKDNNLKITHPRKVVFETLLERKTALTIKEITKACHDVDRTSIYRTLQTFQQIGIINIINVGWKKQYELIDVFLPHHHHLICLKCHNKKSIHDETLEVYIKELCKNNHFQTTKHYFEIEGFCKNCQKIIARPKI